MRGLGFRVLRGSGFRGLGFRGLGFRVGEGEGILHQGSTPHARPYTLSREPGKPASSFCCRPLVLLVHIAWVPGHALARGDSEFGQGSGMKGLGFQGLHAKVSRIKALVV